MFGNKKADLNPPLRS